MAVPARFCPTCLTTEHSPHEARCHSCGWMLGRLFDAEGALSREFLLARGTCCDSGCRNCPYRDDSSTQLKLKPMRIVSLLAGGSEIVHALGAGDWLVGRSHECDNPPQVKRLPPC